MLTVIVALILLIAAVGAVYLILKNMGEEGVEVAAPGSCKSGRCGARCTPKTAAQDVYDEEPLAEGEAVKRKETV